MSKRKRPFLKFTAIAFVVVAGLVGTFLWLSRTPVAELVDDTGKALTAGRPGDRPDDDPARAALREARALVDARQFDDARSALLGLIDRYDLDGEACTLLSEVCREQREMDAAVDYGLKAATLLPHSAEAHLAYAKAQAGRMFSQMQGIGGFLSAMTHLGEFKKTIHRVIELNPDDTEARTMLAFYHMAPPPIGNIDRAMEVSREVLEIDPLAGTELLAACYRRKEDTPQALILLREGIDRWPRAQSLHAAVADIYQAEGRFDKADEAYESARDGEKNEAYYRALYGQARMRIVNEFEPERAIELLDAFIQDEPDFETTQTVAHALWRKGNALELLDRKDDARAAYEDSLVRDPNLDLARDALKALEN